MIRGWKSQFQGFQHLMFIVQCTLFFCTFPTDRKAIKTFFSPKDWIPWGKVYMQYVMPGFICDNAKWLIFSVYCAAIFIQYYVKWMLTEFIRNANLDGIQIIGDILILHNPPRGLMFSSQWHCESVSNRVEWFFICHLWIQTYNFYYRY